ncbi:molybdopterin molybdotransferase MoeA [Agromyces sp. GXS1127]|uniref:molybdopterin molybdotransferase MoeA n=1 Tax=Agromyces sp. GXS1127 TaxID=3424181 RepID=UPI003D31590C
MTDALPWSEARARARAAAPEARPERVPLSAALGRILAESLATAIPLPHFASAAMDGWAVRGPAPWRVQGRDEGVRALGPGEAVEIVTGAVIPDGADAVLRAEAGHVVGDVLEPVGAIGLDDVRGRRHIRPAGAEAAAGDALLEAGAILTPPRIALAAATGVNDLPVARRPRVALVLTGDEVVEEGVPRAGQVRDSFRVALPATLEALGAEVVATRRVGDDERMTRRALLDDDVDLVVTTGGSGRSSADHVRAALAAEGAGLIVPCMATRPAGPTLLARASDRLVLGLPGNPLAAMLGLVTLGAPLLAAWTGTPEPTRTVTAGTDLPGRAGSTGLVPATLAGASTAWTAWTAWTASTAATPADSASGPGAGPGTHPLPGLVAVPVAHVGSGMLRGLAVADVVVVVPPAGVDAGTPVQALALPWTT